MKASLSDVGEEDTGSWSVRRPTVLHRTQGEQQSNAMPVYGDASEMT